MAAAAGGGFARRCLEVFLVLAVYARLQIIFHRYRSGCLLCCDCKLEISGVEMDKECLVLRNSKRWERDRNVIFAIRSPHDFQPMQPAILIARDEAAINDSCKTQDCGIDIEAHNFFTR